MISTSDRLKLITAIVADKRCRRAHIAIAYLLFVRHYNAESGRCDPSVLTLANEAAMGRRHARQVILDLEQWGYLNVETGAGTVGLFGKTNAYTPCSTEQGMLHRAEGKGMLHRAPDAPQGTQGMLHRASKHIREPIRERELPLASPIDPILKHPGGKTEKASTQPSARGPGRPGAGARPKRDRRLYLSKHGCTIDSYDPRCSAMAAWADNKVPLVKAPLAEETIEEIKDLWRRRGDSIKDFDATYRTFLRKRQQWALERQAVNGSSDGSRGVRSRAAI